MPKIDFPEKWAEFLDLADHCRIKVYQINGDEIVVRAGRWGFRQPAKEEASFIEVKRWCEKYAVKIRESIPEELVFA